MLTLSKDRKVTTSSNRAGTTPNIKNTFGLPAGPDFSCPDATSVCALVCYAKKTENMYPNVSKLTLRNWEALKDASVLAQTSMLADIIDEFRAASVKRGSQLAFRIHWDGDFFSIGYAMAWADVIKRNPDIQFWAYTRSFRTVNVVPILADIPNLSLYLSVDKDNKDAVPALLKEYPSLLIAYLDETFAKAKTVMLELTGKPGAACPELTGAIPMIDVNGGACISCGLCPKGKAHIRFASKKK